MNNLENKSYRRTNPSKVVKVHKVKVLKVHTNPISSVQLWTFLSINIHTIFTCSAQNVDNDATLEDRDRCSITCRNIGSEKQRTKRSVERSLAND